MSRRKVAADKRKELRQEWLAGTVAAAIWNSQGGLPAGGESRRAASAADIFPSIAEALGAPRTRPNLEGHFEKVDSTTPQFDDSKVVKLGAQTEARPQDTPEPITDENYDNMWIAWAKRTQKIARARESATKKFRDIQSRRGRVRTS